MEGLKIEYLPIDKLKPYKGNAKKHPSWQIEQIANSISEFGMCDPVGIWGSDNEVVEGHGRLLALQLLGYDEVPVIRLDFLTDEQRRAYCLAHNKLTMDTDFDLKLLTAELENIADIDMGDFGFDTDGLSAVWEMEHEQNKDDETFADANILNTAKAQYDGVPPFDIPPILPVTEVPDVTEWIGFNYVLSEKEPEGKGVHFFLNDYQFERIWNSPDQYMDKLSRFACVASPDFSPYKSMPLVMQLWNHYRKHWVARYMQDHGITVIPTITGSGDDRFDCLQGEPKGGVLITSTMWTNSIPGNYELDTKLWDRVADELHPTHVFVYGPMQEYLEQFNTTRIQQFTEKKVEEERCQVKPASTDTVII